MTGGHGSGCDGSGGSCTIELFKFIIKIYQIIGIYRPASDQTRSPINAKNGLNLFCLAHSLTSTTAHLFIEANSMIDFGLIVLIDLTALTAGSMYVILIWQINDRFHFIENCERFIQNSEY